MTRETSAVRLPLGQDPRDRSYEIRIGAGAMRGIGEWCPPRAGQRAFVIADERLRAAKRSVISALRDAGWAPEMISVRAGESLKDIKAVYPLYGELLKKGADRNAVIFALGGGSIGDAAGFVAATYLRGVDWVGLPTTLLAQVDSSVGGKTGINHRDGKNLIGAFHQPKLVVCDTEFLRTLSSREVVSGFGEVIKYGIAFDEGFYRDLVEARDGFLALDPEALVPAIRRSLEWKTRVVAQDELDRTGVREALNFGHTFAHALEAETGYRRYQHGEAVIWGMRFAAALSEVRGKLASGPRAEVDAFLASLEVPSLPRGKRPADYFRHMSKDKKVEAGKVRFVLLSGLGKTVSDREVRREDLLEAYRLMTGAPNGSRKTGRGHGR